MDQSLFAVVPKKIDEVRHLPNYQKLNTHANISTISIPRVDGVLESLGGGNVFNVFDLFSGFSQLITHADSIGMTRYAPSTPCIASFVRLKELPEHLHGLYHS